MSSVRAKLQHRRGVLLALLTVLALLVPALALAGSGATDRTREVRKAVQGGRARNVLLFIGDGMGDSEITIARNYAVGAAGRLTPWTGSP